MYPVKFILKDKSNNYYIFVTVEGEKLDSKLMKDLVGKKISICSAEELIEKTSCVPGVYLHLAIQMKSHLL